MRFDGLDSEGNFIPSWLTKDYIEDALRSHYNCPALIVRDLQIVPALGKGENYGSIILRINVDFTLGSDDRCTATAHSDSWQKSTYIVKSSFDSDEFCKQFLEPYDFLKREIRIYKAVIPKLKKILQGIGENDKMFVETIKVDVENSALILEDLKESGFRMVDRLRGLDMAHIKLLLDRLAKMHAASVILNERENGVFSSFVGGFFNRHSDVYKGFFIENIKACSRWLRSEPESKSQKMRYYGEKLEKLQDVYMEMGARVFDVKPELVNVLNHGDLWTNNVMFQYDPETQEPKDAVFFDFQTSTWASSAVDLHYLFNTSLEEDIRQERQDELFAFYYGNFRRILAGYGTLLYKAPSLHKFLLQMQEKEFYGFHAAFVVQPLTMSVVTENADYKALMGTDDRAVQFKNALYKNKIVQNKLKSLLPKFDGLGLLEIKQ